MKRVVVIFIMLIGFLCMSNINSYASVYVVDDSIQIADSGTLLGEFNGTDTSEKGQNFIKKIGGMILGVLQVLAIGIGIFMITFLAIKYMSAAPNERASIKTQLVTFTVGAAIVFGAARILEVIMTFSQNTIT